MRQPAELQVTHVPFDKVVPEGHKQNPPNTTKELGQPHVLFVKVRLPVQFWHTFADEQVRQLVTLHALHVPLNKVVPEGHTQVPL